MRITKINEISKNSKHDKLDSHGYNYSHLFSNMRDGICIINDY